MQFFSEVELSLKTNAFSIITLILGNWVCHCWCFDFSLLPTSCFSIHCHWHEIPKYFWCRSKFPSATISSPLLHTTSFIFWHFTDSFSTVFELPCPSSLEWRDETRSLCNSLNNHCCITWGVEKALGRKGAGEWGNRNASFLFFLSAVLCSILQRCQGQEARIWHKSCLNPSSDLNFCSWFSQMPDSLARLECPFQGNPGSTEFQPAASVHCSAHWCFCSLPLQSLSQVAG